MKPKTIEGVDYTPWRVRYRTKENKRRQFTFLSPGHPWVAGEVRRTLDDIEDIDEKKPVLVERV